MCNKKCRKEIKINQNNIEMEQIKKSNKRNSAPAIVFAILVILFGALALAGHSIGWTQVQPVIFSWEMFAIIIGIITLAHRHLFSGLAFAGAGVFFILPKLVNVFPQIILPEDFINNYWGGLVIYFGILLLLFIIFGHQRSFKQHQHFHCHRGKFRWARYNEEVRKRIDESKAKHDKWFYHNVAFSENEHIFLEPMFESGETNVAFGDATIDLRRTDIAEGVTDIFINVAFGNCSLFVPQDWVILTQDTKIVCGSIRDKRYLLDRKTQEETKKHLNIVGSISFGNLDLRN